MSAKSKILQKIESLDPVKDAWEIVQLSVFYEFPWDFNRALELALYKTFAVPSIAKILHQSKQFEKQPQKRYDDTDLILSEIIENGFNERGLKMIEQLNWIHSHYPISNEDYLYVLSTFIFDSAEWINKYGYRKLVRHEEIAGFEVWRQIGEKMKIQQIPNTIEEMKRYHDEYEQKHFRYSEANVKVARATEDLMLGWFLPTPLFEMARPFLHAVMQPQLLQAFNYEEPGFALRTITTHALRTRSFIASLFPRKTPLLRTQHIKHKSYPNGYSTQDLGPEKLMKAASCPFHKVVSPKEK